MHFGVVREGFGAEFLDDLDGLFFDGGTGTFAEFDSGLFGKGLDLPNVFGAGADRGGGNDGIAFGLGSHLEFEVGNFQEPLNEGLF